MKLALTISAVILSFSSGLSSFAEDTMPPAFINKFIQEFEAAPKEVSPGTVWRYQYRGASVYYIPPLYCYDLPSRLYDSIGNLLCEPDGGIAGVGDGQCPDFVANRSNELLLWEDSGLGEPK